LTYDRTRETNVLLFPEGVLVPNPTAAAVLQLCDGATTVSQIADELGKTYQGVRSDDVLNVLTRLAERRVVEWM
jgi:pyrroloquinoline quinone biosynthesis protein D